MESDNGKLRAHLKNFGEQGVDLKALQRVSKAFGKMEPADFVKMLCTELHYARLILRAEAEPEMFFGDTADDRVSNVTRYNDDLMTAESAGYEAGKQGVPRDECPYEDGTEMAKAWKKWWRNGAEFRGEAKPASQPANASKQTLRKRQMRVPGTEDVQRRGQQRKQRAKKEAAPKIASGRRGRPKGSKNKPKQQVNGPEVVDFPAQPPAAA
jgi:ribosome modulation factor